MNDAKDIEEIQEVLNGKKVLISLFIGELGWMLQRFQGTLRHLKHNEYKDWDFILMCNRNLHIFVDDFISYTIDLPNWFYNLGLDQDCYESVVPGSPPGSLTPPEVYQNLVLLLKNICKKCSEFELLLPPRGCTAVLDTRPQIFCKYNIGEIIKNENPIIVVFPRARERAANRNVPEFVWKETVLKLTETFTVVLAGTPSGACLEGMWGKNIVNLINYDGVDKTEQIIKYLNNATCSISSQSGGTHISLLSCTPSYIIGHERERHVQRENRLSIPTSFRYLTDYRAIDSDTIIEDIKGFIRALFKANWFSKINRPSIRTLENKKDLIGVEIGTDTGENALNMLENLDIKKLYLVDPYTIYDGIVGIGCNNNEEQCKQCEEEASKKLEKYEDKIVWVKETSENAINKIPDEIDFVYVDGNHRYEYAKKDIELYYPKVKEGGLISFHDFDYHEVRKAVESSFDKDSIKWDICLDNPDRSEAWVVKPTSMDMLLDQDYNKLLDLICLEE